MKYISTRGGSPIKTFTDILLEGLAPDGGLYLPMTYPRVTPDELSAWRHVSYADLAFAVIGKFIDDIPPRDLQTLIAATYSTECFASHEITPVTTLEPGLHLLHLSNGPTLAFKDIAMQLLGNLFTYALAKTGDEINILGATSGDTGSAAEYAMRGKAGVRVFMLSPQERMSPFQRAQMYSLTDRNIFNIAIDGTFDDCQDLVKAVSHDDDFKQTHRIGTINSINWARLLAQVVYYFRGYLALTRHNDEQVSFAVPSGNFGNICAGHIARCMGLPIKRLVVATNENDVLHEFFRHGVYRPRRSAETYTTSSPSMDISRASNFERFVFDLTEREPTIVRQLWSSLENGGAFDLSGTHHFQRVEQFGFVSGKSTHTNRLDTIRHAWNRYSIEIDPHTADGLKVALDYREIDVRMICLETAQPAKFEATIEQALGRKPVRPKGFAGIENQPQRFTVMPADVAHVKSFINAHIAHASGSVHA
ncbi:MAG: threonine synthase [Gammaproteobacteria bacterium]|nr:threonine synthase [Gammaproteobacteria bacterium]